MPHTAAANTPPAISSREQIKALGVASLGGMLEYFEFICYVFLAPQISRHFSSPDMPEWLRLMQTFGIFAAGFLMRPVGGILMAQIGDKVGRKRIFTLTLALMAGPTLLIGFLPGFAQIGIWAPILLLACRLLQGISLGGELPGAINFVSEQFNERKVVLAIGILSSVMGLSVVAGSGVVTGLARLMGAEAMMDYGWRIPFVMGGIFGLVSVYLRRFTHETPVFEAMKARKMLSVQPPFAELMAKHRFNLVCAMVLAASTAVTTSATQQFPITYFVSMKQLPLAEVSTYVTLMIACSSLGNFLGSLLVYLGVFSLRNGYIAMQLLATACLFWVFNQKTTAGLLLPFICLGLSAGGGLSIVLTLLARSFPAQVRYTGLATCYNIPIAIFGGTTLLILTFLARYSLGYPPFYPAVFLLLSCAAAMALAPRFYPINPFTQEAAGVAPHPHSSAGQRARNRTAAAE